ncbi:MAG: S46 family peptidase [Acidobacteriota bacterium]
MKKKLLSFALVLVTLLILPVIQSADEGMWLPEDIKSLPITRMRAKGLKLAPEEIYRTDGLSIKDAIVSLGGGTGSFVSPEGLIITNHHVAFDGIAGLSTPQANYLENGFVAQSRSEELPMKGYTVSITREVKDVTQEILAAVKPQMTYEERQKAIEAKRREVAEAANQKNPELGYNVVEMLPGLKYHLYIFETVRDIRLVYAPPKSIGFFGGDDDNFIWPRHTGDFTFLRAYVGVDGKVATYSDKNVPYRPKKYLTLSLQGYKEGDFTMVMGFPGRTFRLRESYSIEFQQNIFLPFFIDLLQARINLLDEAGRQDTALQLRYASQKFGLSNALKNFQGSLVGLKRSNLIEQKRAEEIAFQRYIEQHPDLKEKYGELLPKLAEVYRDQNSFYVRNNLLGGLMNTSDTLRAVSFAVGRALDQEKPEAERSPIYSAERVERIKRAFAGQFKERNPALERKLIELYLNKLLALPNEQKVAFLEQRFGGRNDAARATAVADFARRVLEDSSLQNEETINKLFDMPLTQMRTLSSPTIDFVTEVNNELEQIRKRDQNFNNSVARLRSLYIEAMTGFKKGLFYPDANSTLRFTYGEIRGYRPRDGVYYSYVTTLQGVVEKDTGKEPFNVPTVLKDLSTRREFGSYVDTKVNDVPVAFLTTNDITGGNSGSPILNGNGELIGVVFDGNYEGLGSDYVYNSEQSRTIGVDIRYVLFLAEKMAAANHLLKELEIHGKGATAAAK